MRMGDGWGGSRCDVERFRLRNGGRVISHATNLSKSQYNIFISLARVGIPMSINPLGGFYSRLSIFQSKHLALYVGLCISIPHDHTLLQLPPVIHPIHSQLTRGYGSVAYAAQPVSNPSFCRAVLLLGRLLVHLIFEYRLKMCHPTWTPVTSPTPYRADPSVPALPKHIYTVHLRHSRTTASGGQRCVLR